MLLLEGQIWLGDGLKPVAALTPQVLTLRGFPCSGEQVAICLTDDQLVALELARRSDDLRFRVDLQVTVLGQPSSVHPSQTTQVGYRIAARRWLELLDQAGAEVGITVRVPSPLTDSAAWDGDSLSEDAPSLTQAAKRLRQARRELRDGSAEHCVATCRKALENLRRLRPLPPPAEVFKIKPEHRTQERWAALFYDLVSLTSAAHHDDAVTDGFAWSRADAEAVLASTRVYSHG